MSKRVYDASLKSVAKMARCFLKAGSALLQSSSVSQVETLNSLQRISGATMNYRPGMAGRSTDSIKKPYEGASSTPKVDSSPQRHIRKTL